MSGTPSGVTTFHTVLRDQPLGRHGGSSSTSARTSSGCLAAATDAARVLLGGPDGVNPSATHAPLVAQQLQVLENPSLIWRGELWPGQRLEWRLEENIEDDPEHRAATATDEAPGWSSTLLLDLPNLGRVRLGLALDAAGDFRIQLAAAGAARAALGAASNEALAALTAVVERHGKNVILAGEVHHAVAERMQRLVARGGASGSVSYSRSRSLRCSCTNLSISLLDR